MANVSVPGSELTPTGAAERVAGAVPGPVRELLSALWAAGHAAYIVGGSIRDVLLGREAADWDLATDARPDRIVAIFPDAAYENRFGTVGVRRPDGVHEITTFRSDHEYADYRRPHRVEFGESIELDLGRRDFTVNAMAWGAERPVAEAARRAAAPAPVLVDPFGGLADLRLRRLRAVGDPVARFEEDALRMIRAVRLAATLGFEIEPATLDGIRTHARLAEYLSGERIAAELEKLLAAPHPSIGLRLMAETGLLAVVFPDLAAQIGIPQNKVPGEDLWDHTLRTVDAAPAARPVVRLAALVHDLGKPGTLSDGHFYGHDAAGAELAADLLRRLRVPRATIDRVVCLVRHHMFVYDPSWGDAAVRRFIGKIGQDALDELFALRVADNEGSGLPADDGEVSDLHRRIRAELAAEVALDRGGLAVNGDDLISELGLAPGPALGRVLDRLLDRVIADPSLNDRPTLLMLAQAMLGEET